MTRHARACGTRRGNSLVALAALGLFWASFQAVPARAQEGSGAPDARHIAESSIAVTRRHWQARLGYTYTERDESRRLDLKGQVHSEDVDVSRRIVVNGVPFELLVERNGRPPSPAEERLQQEKIERLKQETAEHRGERLRREAEENTSLVEEIPKAFDFRLIGEDTVNGRPAWVLQATPHPGYQPHGKYGRMFPKVEGRLWVDKIDLGWVKVDGQVTQSFSLGLFLARVLAGSRITMEQTRVDEGLWMPAHVEVRAAAKILFLKSLVIERVVMYSEYSLPRADATAAASGSPGNAVSGSERGR